MGLFEERRAKFPRKEGFDEQSPHRTLKRSKDKTGDMLRMLSNEIGL